MLGMIVQIGAPTVLIGVLRPGTLRQVETCACTEQPSEAWELSLKGKASVPTILS